MTMGNRCEGRTAPGRRSAFYPTGVTLANPGDTLTFSVLASLDRPLVEVTNGLDGYTPGLPIFWQAGTYFAGTCTVTAVRLANSLDGPGQVTTLARPSRSTQQPREGHGGSASFCGH